MTDAHNGGAYVDARVFRPVTRLFGTELRIEPMLALSFHGFGSEMWLRPTPVIRVVILS